ncbi:MAG: hypothetical protein ACTSV5_00500 [Promethearchaeota archaeon]
MAEFSKFMKVVFYINLIAAFIYGILYLFIPDLYASLIDTPAYDPHFWRLWGGTCLSLGIIGILGLVRNDWAQFKVIIELVILWLLISNILNLASFVYLTRSPTNAISELLDVIVIFFIIVLDTYALLQENKR